MGTRSDRVPISVCYVDTNQVLRDGIIGNDCFFNVLTVWSELFVFYASECCIHFIPFILGN